MSLTNFEKEVIDKILIGNSTTLSQLRNQVIHSEIINRDNSSVGYFIHFNVPNQFKLKRDDDFTLGTNILINMEGLKDGAGCILFIKNGSIDMLEFYTFGEDWPKNISKYEIIKQAK